MSSSRSGVANQSLCLCVRLSPFFSVFGVFELKKQFQWCFKDVPKKFKYVSRHIKRCFEGVLSAFEGYLKVAQRVLYFQTVEYIKLTSVS